MSNAEPKQVYLPSTEKEKDETKRLWVVINVGPLTGRDFMSFNSEDPSGLNTMRRLAGRIKEWNLKDAHGDALPITLDNVADCVLFEDLMFLRQTMDNEVPAPHGLETEEKKD